MKVQWLYPENRKCGISIYSHDYMRELKNKCTVIPQDISTVADKVEPLLIRKDSADLVHIQYETSFFLKKEEIFISDYYRKLRCRS